MTHILTKSGENLQKILRCVASRGATIARVETAIHRKERYG
jgi:hypothetical protein